MSGLTNTSMCESNSDKSIYDCGANVPDQSRVAGARRLDIALVNNMPSAAIGATERQFQARLNAAADGVQVRVTFFACPEITRTEQAREHIRQNYSSIDELWGARFDGVIVTGAEPLAPTLKEEAYWGTMLRLIEWAEQNTDSAIWSCLAAHAAVLHLDGISRCRLEEKRSGVFECEKLSAHPLLLRVPARFWMPHSRWNDLSRSTLEESGYTLLSGSPDAGVDAFAKNGKSKSLFLFFQGHPEYEPATLLLEYRRDIERYLRGVCDRYPSMPQGYLDDNTAGMLTALRQRAQSARGVERLAEFPTADLVSRVRDTWSPAAVEIYRNWLLYLVARKEQRLRTTRRRSERKAGAGQQAA